MAYLFRSLSKSGSLAAIAIVVLALGIGANTAIFSVVNAVFLRPLPYSDSERLVEVREARGQNTISVSYPNFLDWRQQADVFEGMAAKAAYDATLETAATAERLPVSYVSASFFSILRSKPVLGRDFRPDDDRPGALPVVVLTHSLWQSQFASNPNILGTSIRLDKRPYTVIGVLPAEFRFYEGTGIFVPISDTVIRKALYLRDNHNMVSVVARLKPGVTPEQAQLQMSAIARRLERAYEENTGIGVRVTTLRERLSGDARRPIGMLAGAVCLVLLIACVNVANLLLARAADRRKEMALRAALGASRGQLLRQLLLENTLLAVTGGVLGTLLAGWSFAGLVRLVPASIAAGGLSIDLRVLAFTLLVCLITGVLFGLAPALEAWKVDLNEALHEVGRTTGSSGRGRLRDALVVAEVALALVLLAGAGLFLRTLYRVSKVPLGFQTEKILTARVSLPVSSEFTVERGAAFFEQLVARLQNLPGVASAGIVSHLPLSDTFASMNWFRTDRPIPERGKLPWADQRYASPEYFATLGIPLLKGRLFTPADGRVTNFRQEQILTWLRSNRFSVVINETMAERFWPGEDPVGKTFIPGPPEMALAPVTILGVVGDVRDYGPDSEPAPTFYLSSFHFPSPAYWLVVRARSEPSALAAAVHRASAGLDASAMVTDISPMGDFVAASVAGRRLHALLLGIFAGLALLLAAVGIHGVMSYAVRRRTHEIGIRIALGAAHTDILRMVLGKAVMLGGIGVAVGSAAAFVLTRLIASMLYGVTASDPLTFIVVALILFLVTVAAGLAPARHAVKVSPLAALREE